MKVHVKKGDTVQVRTGVDAGKRGKVIEVQPKKGRVIVDGMNLVKKHTKPGPANRTGGVIERPAPIPSSRVQLVCPSCSKPTRVGRKRTPSGGVERVCKRCGKTID